MKDFNKALPSVTKEELMKMLAKVPDGAKVFILSSVQDVGRALAVTASASDTDDKRDQSEVVMSIEGPVAHDPVTGIHFIVAGYLEH
jgi:hypothetical protein